MCGIFCILSKKNGSASLGQKFKLFENLISNRGPNSLKTEVIHSDHGNIFFAASVLWLQGSQIAIQPIMDGGSVFIYNGDNFGGPGFDDLSKQNIGDTKLFFEYLQKSEDIIATLSSFEGPYAFIFLKNDKLYFGRDPYGRRSLLVGKNSENIILTSVAKRNTEFNFIELPCTGVFCIDLHLQTWQLYPWKRRNKNFDQKLQELELSINEVVVKEQLDFIEPICFTPPTEDDLKLFSALLNSPNILEYFCQINKERINTLKTLLENSVKKRIQTQPKFCQNCFNSNNCTHAITGVLFSGGVDCAILAYLSHNFVEESRPIDLINVAFEKDGNFNTPDRLTGKETLAELQTLYPQRTWNFVEVNVTRQELDLCRKERISDLIYPLNSVLDDSLGCALWFASKASMDGYTSPCRTLLVGMGADELFGGYTRHRAAFQKKSWQGLHEVLEEDWQNLPHRNLARDDRVVSDHGRQLRTPYLDEKFVEFVRSLNCWDRTIPSKDLPQGIGEKILLRSLAYHLGLHKAALFKKRALQFGSRIANKKEKGHQTAERLQE